LVGRTLKWGDGVKIWVTRDPIYGIRVTRVRRSSVWVATGFIH